METLVTHYSLHSGVLIRLPADWQKLESAEFADLYLAPLSADYTARITVKLWQIPPVFRQLAYPLILARMFALEGEISNFESVEGKVIGYPCFSRAYLKADSLIYREQIIVVGEMLYQISYICHADNERYYAPIFNLALTELRLHVGEGWGVRAGLARNSESFSYLENSLGLSLQLPGNWTIQRQPGDSVIIKTPPHYKYQAEAKVTLHRFEEIDLLELDYLVSTVHNLIAELPAASLALEEAFEIDNSPAYMAVIKRNSTDFTANFAKIIGAVIADKQSLYVFEGTYPLNAEAVYRPCFEHVFRTIYFVRQPDGAVIKANPQTYRHINNIVAGWGEKTRRSLTQFACSFVIPENWESRQYSPNELKLFAPALENSFFPITLEVVVFDLPANVAANEIGFVLEQPQKMGNSWTILSKTVEVGGATATAELSRWRNGEITMQCYTVISITNNRLYCFEFEYPAGWNDALRQVIADVLISLCYETTAELKLSAKPRLGFKEPLSAGGKRFQLVKRSE
jgi:hypothetical protein